MGGNPYFYFTPYEADIDAALRKLREREFQAGRYDPALRAADPPTYTFQQSFPPGPSFPSPGAQHDSIEEAFEAGMESADGTGSISTSRGSRQVRPSSTQARFRAPI